MPQQVRRFVIQKQLFTEPVQTPGQLPKRIITVGFILPVTLSGWGIGLSVTDAALRQIIVLIPGITLINGCRRDPRTVRQPGYLCGDTPAAVILRPLIKPAGEPVSFTVGCIPPVPSEQTITAAVIDVIRNQMRGLATVRTSDSETLPESKVPVCNSPFYADVHRDGGRNIIELNLTTF